MSTMSDLAVNGIDLRVHEAGSGDLIVMCHGFPGMSYSFRHQMQPLADAGWHVVAPDMRGYGGSSAPPDPADYGADAICGDLLGLLDHYGAEQAVFVGHDFGARAVYDMALRHPDRVRSLIVLSVPYMGYSPRLPSETFGAMAEDHFIHFEYFKEYGPADQELAGDTRGFITRVMWALSGQYRYLDIWKPGSQGKGYLDVLPEAPALPWPWLTEADIDHYVDEYTRTGFTGGLNWYRSADVEWRQMADWATNTIDVPTWLIAGANDTVIEMYGPEAADVMGQLVPDLREFILIPDVGHFVQMEAADRLNRELVRILGDVPKDSA